MVREGGRAHLARWAMEEISDPSSAGARAQAVMRAMRSAGISQRNVVCSISRSDATLKRIHLPSADAEAVRKMLAFEAQQHVPFPLEEVAWDFSLGAAGEAGGAVLLAAARKTLLEDLRAVLAQAGLRAQAVTLTSLAAAAACLQNDGQAGGDGREAAVMVELGAGTAVVNVFRGGALHLSRPLPVTGDDLTKAFAADTQSGPQQAEEIRRTRGMAAIPQESKRVAEWLHTLRMEVERSLLAAAEGEASLSVENVVITGGGWQTPGLAEAFSAVLGAPVVTCPLARVAPKSPAQGGPAGQPEGYGALPALGSAIGLALQGLGLAKGIDLLSAAATSARTTSRRSLTSAVAVAVLLCALTLGTWRYWWLQGQSLSLQPVQARAEQREREISALSARKRSLETRLGELRGIMQKRGEVMDALDQISAKAPDGMWLTSVTYSSGRPLVAQGKALSNQQVARLLDALGPQATLTYIKQAAGNVDFAITITPDAGGRN